MEITYFALGLVVALVVAEVLAWFSVIKMFNRYSKNITDIQMKNEELICSSKEQLQILNLRVDDLENRIYRDIGEVHRDIGEVHTRIGTEIDRLHSQIDSRMDKFDLKLKKDLLKG
jgi:hypothetical protein